MESSDTSQDCFGCKVTGSLTMAGISTYMLHLRASTSNKRHQMFFAVCAIGKIFALSISLMTQYSLTLSFLAAGGVAIHRWNYWETMGSNVQLCLMYIASIYKRLMSNNSLHAGVMKVGGFTVPSSSILMYCLCLLKAFLWNISTWSWWKVLWLPPRPLAMIGIVIAYVVVIE